MFTLLKAKENFDKARKYLKKKDEIAIKKVERRFRSNDKFSRDFMNKVYDVYDEYRRKVPHIVDVLEEYLDNPLIEVFFDTPFDKERVCNTLLDMQFVATLMCTSLLKRTVNLETKSENQLKLRIYVAILNYDKYKRSHVIRKIVGKGKGQKVIAKCGGKK